MISVAPGTKVYLACRPVSMRYGFDGLAALVTRVLEAGKFVWSPIVDGGMVLTPAQLGLLIGARDWRGPVSLHYILAMSLASAPFPTDPDALQVSAAGLQAELARKDIEITARDAEIHAKTLHTGKLKAQLAMLHRARFGRSSEKLDRDVEQLELGSPTLCMEAKGRLERIKHWDREEILAWQALVSVPCRAAGIVDKFCGKVRWLASRFGKSAPRKVRENHGTKGGS